MRFEAWVPEDLYRDFQRQVRGGRKAWLVRALREFVAGEGEGDGGNGKARGTTE